MKKLFLFLLVVGSASIYAQTGSKPVLTVSGKVLNALTNEIIPDATIQFFNLDTAHFKKLGSVISNYKDGTYKIGIERDEKMSIYCEIKGFYPLSIVLFSSKLADSTKIKRDIYLLPDGSDQEVHFHEVLMDTVKVGEIIRLNNVLFDNDQSVVKLESQNELNLLAEYLNANPTVEIEISGHTDDKGTPGYNLTLSQQRVYSVIKYLINKGVNKKRMKGVGYGMTRPIVKNDSQQNRALNRRVEFKIIKK